MHKPSFSWKIRKELSGLSSDILKFLSALGYETTLEKPDVEADNWELNLGNVRESTSVYINDEYIGTAWAPPFKLKTGNCGKE